MIHCLVLLHMSNMEFVIMSLFGTSLGGSKLHLKNGFVCALTPSLPGTFCLNSFLPAETKFCSYNTATLAYRQAWQCCMNRGLSLASRNESKYFKAGSERVDNISER